MEGKVKVHGELVSFSTPGELWSTDLTHEVEKIVKNSGITEGIVVVSVIGSTGAVGTIEFESGLQKDIATLMEELIPSKRHWRHNDTWGDANGHSHLRATLLGPSVTIPVSKGKPVLGTWQQIFFIEFDIRPRNRKVFVQVMGI